MATLLAFSPVIYAEKQVSAPAHSQTIPASADATAPNNIGFSLLLMGIAFMMAEIYLFTFGFLAISGFVAFIIGSFLLFADSGTSFSIAWPFILAVGLGTLAFIILIISIAIRGQRRKIITGQEALIGKDGTVIAVSNEKITVQVLGEIWNAKSHHPLVSGQKIRVTHLSGLELTVEPSHKNT